MSAYIVDRNHILYLVGAASSPQSIAFPCFIRNARP